MLHISEAKVLNLSREDVFTLLSDDFNDLFRAWYAPYNKIIYLCLYVRYGILRLVLFCLKAQYFSHVSWLILVTSVSLTERLLQRLWILFSKTRLAYWLQLLTSVCWTKHSPETLELWKEEIGPQRIIESFRDLHTKSAFPGTSSCLGSSSNCLFWITIFMHYVVDFVWNWACKGQHWEQRLLPFVLPKQFHYDTAPPRKQMVGWVGCENSWLKHFIFLPKVACFMHLKTTRSQMSPSEPLTNNLVYPYKGINLQC